MSAVRNQLTSVSGWVRARVKSYDRGRGFGFLTVTADRRDVFFHVKTLTACRIPCVNDGDIIECRYGETPNGLAAMELRYAQ